MAGLYTTAGRMHIVNGSGETVFDTDEGLFVVTNVVTGSATLPSRVASSGAGGTPINTVNVDVNHTLAFVESAATIVRGVFSVSVAAGSGEAGNVTNLGAFNANGSYMHTAVGRPLATGSITEIMVVNGFAVYTFFVSSGTLYINERVAITPVVRLSGGGFSTTLLAPTFTYNLFVGTYV